MLYNAESLLQGQDDTPVQGRGFFLPLRPHPSSSRFLGLRPKNPKNKEREAFTEASGGGPPEDEGKP